MSRKTLTSANFDSVDANAFVEEALGRPHFEPSREIVIARAPGRLDLMGGIADYSGSLVLQWPLREATLAATQLVSDGRLQATSLGLGPGAERSFTVEVAELFPAGQPLEYEAARAWFAARPQHAWAAYVLGALIVLARESGVLNPSGVRILIRSEVPEGKGVSSSAALEVAVMKSLAAALHLPLDSRQVALLAQTVENRIVGAACGVMDQMTSSCGVSEQLLVLLCQPAELRGTLALPRDLEIWGIDSGVRHAVSGSDYTSVRVSAFMGARILAARAGLAAAATGISGQVSIDDPRWRGYLANVTPSEFESGLLGRLPDSMTGSEFLAQYEGIVDSVTRVDPTREYAVRACTAHPIYEHFRVRAFAELLQEASDDRSERLGQLMYQSHASYSACGLGAEATDQLVAAVRDAGPKRGFFGAKITGGGSGGTVAVLGRRGADIGEIARAFETRSGRRPRVFSGSSSGADAFGVVRLGAA